MLDLDRRVRRKRVGMRAHFRLDAAQPPAPWVDVYLGRGHELYVTPLPGGELLVAALAEADAVDGRIEDLYRRWRQAHRALALRLDGAEQVSDLLVTSPLSARARRRVLPGFVLLGDAAGFTDPITGGGMTQALVTAELLAEHAAQARLADDAWLPAFERERDAWLRDYRRLTALILWLSRRPALVPPTLKLLQAAPTLFSHLLGVSGGMRRLLGGEARRAHGAAQEQPPGPTRRRTATRS
jgi:flavin-dependent dehydrogenase